MLSKEVRRLSNYAVTLLSSKKRKAALPLLKRAAELSNYDDGIWCNLAIAYTNEGKYIEASQIFYQLVTRNPNNLAAWHGYGVLNLVAALPQDAVGCFKKCCELDPKNGSMVFDTAIANMQSGNWEEGLVGYESRRSYKPERYFPELPAYDGAEGKTVYVWAEQGIGDTFQYARFLPWLAERSKKVVFALPNDLHKLFKGYEKYCEIVGHVDQVTGVDCECPLMSLAYHYGVHIDAICYHLPDDPKLLAQELSTTQLTINTGRLKVGLCWATNPSSHHYLERSLPFADLLQITANEKCDFYSVQVGPASEDIKTNGAELVIKDLSPNLIDDWCATATALNEMDVVVTTDTSVAHLAAILQKPTLMLLARRDWWRWGNEGSKTPWYPTMTIIRQHTQNKWGPEFEEVSQLLDASLKKSI